jgi:hypothetical protein
VYGWVNNIKDTHTHTHTHTHTYAHTHIPKLLPSWVPKRWTEMTAKMDVTKKRITSADDTGASAVFVCARARVCV